MNNNDKMSVEHSQIINGNVPVTNHIGCHCIGAIEFSTTIKVNPCKDVHGTRYGIFL